MKQIVVLALGATLFTACGQKEAAVGPELTLEQAAQIESEYVLATNETQAAAVIPKPEVASEPARVATQPVARPIQERLSGAIHAKLTLQLRMYIEKNGRVPDNFSEFINAAMDSVPGAPDGMKFVIDSTDRTVKVVKK